jgi:hypothetical protein
MAVGQDRKNLPHDYGGVIFRKEVPRCNGVEQLGPLQTFYDDIIFLFVLVKIQNLLEIGMVQALDHPGIIPKHFSLRSLKFVFVHDFDHPFLGLPVQPTAMYFAHGSDLQQLPNFIVFFDIGATLEVVMGENILVDLHEAGLVRDHGPADRGLPF